MDGDKQRQNQTICRNAYCYHLEHSFTYTRTFNLNIYRFYKKWIRVKESLLLKDQINVSTEVASVNYYLFVAFLC